MKLAPGWALIRVNFDPIQKKSRGWPLFYETTVCIVMYSETFVSVLKPELKTFDVSVGLSSKPNVGHLSLKF